MNAFIWGENYFTGLLKVDDQHKELVDLINQLARELTEDTLNEESIALVFKSMSDYAVFHFDEEEKMMKERGLDERHIEAHKALHRAFIEDANALFSKSSATSILDMEAVLDFLVHWLAYHILGTDKFMANQLSLIDSGVSASEAYETEELNFSASTEPLLEALSDMVQQVTERNRELMRLNLSLESIVEERTKELVEANKRLEALAVTDGLTNLHNRRFAMNILSKLWAEDHPDLSCIMIDADKFKEINDQYGHDAGDIVLVEVARILQASVRNDDFVCRLGGDEFLIVFPKTDFDSAMSLARKILATINDTEVNVGAGSWKGQLSMGVATRAASMDSYLDLIKQADESLYLSKRNGKNCVSAVQQSES